MNTPPMLRNSERNDFKRCQWRWWQVWVEQWKPKRDPTWAWFGSAIHVGLSARYPVGRRRGSVTDMLDAFEGALYDQVRKVYTAGEELDETEIVDGKELGRAMLLGYVEEYGDDTDWQVIHNEQAFQIDVPHPTKKDAIIAVLCGTWDLVVYDLRTKTFKVVDHKTRRSFPSSWGFYSINDQAGTYLWVAPEVLRFLGLLKKKQWIEGLVFNCLRKALPDKRPQNAAGEYTNLPKKEHYHAALEAANVTYPPRATIAVLQGLAAQARLTVLGEASARQPTPLFHREDTDRLPSERVKQARRVQDEALQMQDIRSGRRRPTKTPTEDCERCPVFDMCQLDEQDEEEGMEFAQAVYHKRDPYADHREDMETKGGIYLERK